MMHAERLQPVGGQQILYLASRMHMYIYTRYRQEYGHERTTVLRSVRAACGRAGVRGRGMRGRGVRIRRRLRAPGGGAGKH